MSSDVDLSPSFPAAASRWSAKCLLIVSTMLLAWLWMQIVHECGHVFIGWMTGGTVTRVVAHPLAISRTDLDQNPHPLLVCWGGPVLGVAIPLFLWLISLWKIRLVEWWLRFFVGFCLIANGAYLAVGSVEGIGDAGDLIRLGSPEWSLWLFGAVTIPVGLLFWHGLGRQFGIGREGLFVSWIASLNVLFFLMATIVGEMILSQPA